MKYNEQKGNLFELNEKYYLGHCISADFITDNRAMGLGIVTKFNKRFNMKNKIKNHCNKLNIIPKVGDCVLVDNCFNLITKSKYYGKPTYATIERALESMKEVIIENNIKYIGLCKIGSGLDKLSWDKVREIIQDKFKDLDIEIEVRYL